MISELNDELCGFCQQKGFTGRDEIISELGVASEDYIADFEYWIWTCSKCGQKNKTLIQIRGKT